MAPGDGKNPMFERVSAPLYRATAEQRPPTIILVLDAPPEVDLRPKPKPRPCPPPRGAWWNR